LTIKSTAPASIAPAVLDHDGIDKVVGDFGRAAERTVEAGFDVVEIHAAHGYLIHNFLSPLSNLRSDEYGGSLENRARLLLRIVDAVRALIPDEMPLFVRFSATDWVEGGWTVEETAQVAAWAHEAGADLFDISTGGLIRDIFISVSPGYQVPLAESVRRLAGVPVAAVGKILSAGQAQDIVSSGSADAVFLGRELIRDPHIPLRWAAELGAEMPGMPLSFGAADWRPRAGL